MKLLEKFFLAFILISFTILGGCEDSDRKLLQTQTPSATPSMAILENPETIDIPQEVNTKPLAPIQTPEPAQTISVKP